MSDAVSQFEAFRRRREESVTSAQGATALTLTKWVSEPTEIEGVPGVWAPAATGDGLAVTAVADDNVVVDGRVVDGTVTVYPKVSMTPSQVRLDDARTAYVIGDPSGGYALRLWDADAHERRGFQGISAYDYDESMVFAATFEAVADGVGFEYEKSQGGAVQHALSPGIVHFQHGDDYALVALPDGESLQIVFADTTTGDETYDVGRFLFVRPKASGVVELDFNRAVVPPCSMSDQFNCPLPPAQNRLRFAVRAGERRPMFEVADER